MSYGTTEALSAKNITAIGIGTIVVLLVLGLLIGLLITALIARVIVAVVVVALAVIVWQQRSSIQDKVEAHNCNLTFFGMHVDPPQSITKYC